MIFWDGSENEFEEERERLHDASTEHQLLLLNAISLKSPITEITSLIEAGACVNKAATNGIRPLHHAVDKNYVECVSLLLLKGAEINVTDENGLTPLLLSACRGYFKAMQVLIDNDAIINYCDSDRKDVPNYIREMGYLTYDPLNMTIENNHVQCVKLLLENGALSNKKYYMGYEINLVPINHVTCLELLLKHGANPNLCSRYGMTPLVKACKENMVNAVCLLLGFGADVNLQCRSCYKWNTPLNTAIEYNATNVVNILLQSGAHVSKETGCKYSPLHEAVLLDSPDICRLVLSFGARVNDMSDDHFSPLMLAVKTSKLLNRVEIITILLQNGSDPNLYHSSSSVSVIGLYLKNNKTSLDKAVICLLLQYGANLNFTTRLPCGKSDPFGILLHLSDCCQQEILHLLLTTTRNIDREAIKKCANLNQHQREYLMCLTATPRQLVCLTRGFISYNFGRDLVDKVNDLPLPKTIKRYLMFKETEQTGVDT
ncbi:ankyrin-1-like [Mytilus trossulus]|uniref:ankyrin-1-like n=1 Tax=Mytilus trossulus TaxID=6551 RepID=UPI003005FB47